jgi:hypothetical protein
MITLEEAFNYIKSLTEIQQEKVMIDVYIASTKHLVSNPKFLIRDNFLILFQDDGIILEKSNKTMVCWLEKRSIGASYSFRYVGERGREYDVDLNILNSIIRKNKIASL